MACNLREFLEDADGRGSAARLNMMIGVIFGAIINLSWPYFYKTPCGKDLSQMCSAPLPAEIFFTFMLATGGVYGLGKWKETTAQIEQIKADSPNQAPTVVVPPLPLGPTTTINVGSAKTEKIADANITAEGDVNVNKPKRKK